MLYYVMETALLIPYNIKCRGLNYLYFYQNYMLFLVITKKMNTFVVILQCLMEITVINHKTMHKTNFLRIYSNIVLKLILNCMNMQITTQLIMMYNL